MRNPRNRKHRAIKITVAAVIAVAAISVIGIAAGGGGAPPAAHYKATETSIIVSPADLAVFTRVVNTGTHATTPVCTINASDPSGAYTGYDQITAVKPLAPGHVAVYRDDVVITSQGARYVTTVTVKCS